MKKMILKTVLVSCRKIILLSPVLALCACVAPTTIINTDKGQAVGFFYNSTIPEVKKMLLGACYRLDQNVKIFEQIDDGRNKDGDYNRLVCGTPLPLNYQNRSFNEILMSPKTSSGEHEGYVFNFAKRDGKVVVSGYPWRHMPTYGPERYIPGKELTMVALRDNKVFDVYRKMLFDMGARN